MGGRTTPGTGLKAIEHKELHDENRQLDIKIRSVNQGLRWPQTRQLEAFSKTAIQAGSAKEQVWKCSGVVEHIPSLRGVDDEETLCICPTLPPNAYLVKVRCGHPGLRLRHDTVIAQLAEVLTSEVSIDGAALV
jgi:hypothetical protein